MKRAIALMASFTVAFSLLGFLFAAPAVSAQANAPVWEEGYKWAMGKEVDIGTAVGDTSDIEEALAAYGVSVEQFDIDGTAESWIVFEVVDVTDSEYNLSVDCAGKVAAEVHVSITAQLWQAGTYTASEFASAPTEQKTIDIDLVEDFGIVLNGNVVFEKTTMAVKSIAFDLQASAVGSFDATNIPSIESSGTNVIVSYSTYNIEVSFDLDMSVNVDFDPALNLYDFPLDVGDEWTIESTATVSGTIDGFLDVNGLPDDLKDQIFTDEFVEQTGVDDFPIEFDEISSSGEGATINNGVIETYEAPIYAELACAGKVSMDVFNLGSVEVYKIVVNGDEGQYYYSDGFKFMTGMGMDLSGLELPEEIPGGLTPEVDMEMDTVDPDDAQSAITDVGTYQAGVSEDATGEQGDGTGGLGIDPMILAVILIVVIAVVLVAVVFVLKRKKP
ncbi:MAG: hypothetical protein LUQ27_00690 [Methanomassiliicoccales archaeon]|nr:hypothetical protein [Methanomassiliicoccales archaeon]